MKMSVVEIMGARSRGGGLGGLGSTEQEQAAAVAQMAAIEANIRATVDSNMLRWGPGIDSLASNAALAASGNPNDVARAAANMAAMALSLIGPIGIAIGGAFKALTEFMLWLQTQFPAVAVSCPPDLAKVVWSWS